MALQRNASPRLLLFAATLAIPSGTTLAAGPVRGVTDTEIIIGTMTDLSGVTAVQAVNNVNAVRMAFDEANANGGVHGRKIKYIVEDMQYQVPKAVQAMNKLLNRDNIFFAIVNGGTPMNDAVMPMMFEKNVPNVFPLTAARSMYEPFNRFKFGQFASYYDEMRAGVKYFVEQKGRKAICAMYQDSDFGRDVLAGAEAEAQALGLKIRRADSSRADRHRLHIRGDQAARGKLRYGGARHDHPRHDHHPADRAQAGLEPRFRRSGRHLFHRYR